MKQTIVILLTIFLTSCAANKVAETPLQSPPQVDSYHIDWNKFKTVDDLILILKTLYPKLVFNAKKDSITDAEILAKFKHLLIDADTKK